MHALKRKKESIKVLKRRVAVTGFFAGLIWSSIWAFLSFFNFSKLSPSSFVLQTWRQVEWMTRWYGELLSIVIISIVSILIAYIYYFLFRKRTGMLPGIIYGIGLWLIMILLFSSLFAHIPYLNQIDLHTLTTTLSLMIIYGVFIGYTISYDFLDQPSDK